MPDFETLPCGSLAELVRLREFACWVMMPHTEAELRAGVEELREWYREHLEKYSI